MTWALSVVKEHSTSEKLNGNWLNLYIRAFSAFGNYEYESKYIVRFSSGFAFKNNFTFTKLDHLVWEE